MMRKALLYNKARNLDFRPPLFPVSVMVLVAFLTFACSGPTPEDNGASGEIPSWSDGTQGDEQKSAGEKTALEKISAINDVFELMQLKEAYETSGEASQRELDGIRRRLDEIVAKQGAKTISEAVEVAGIDLKAVGEERYEISLLFKVHQPLEEDFSVYVLASPDESCLGLFPDNPYIEKYKWLEWWFSKPQPPTSTWKPDEYILLKRLVTTPAIAYEIKAGIKGHGRRVSLGWWVDLEEWGDPF